MKLAAGLYEELVTEALEHALNRPEWIADRRALHSDAASDLLARHVQQATHRALEAIKDDRLSDKLALTNALLGVLTEHAPRAVMASDRVNAEVLYSLLTRAEAGAGDGHLPRPGIPLRHSELVVNGPRDRRIGLEIRGELPSADRVDLLMSFVKWSGFVELREALGPVARRGELRVLTTTYMGATDSRALDALVALGATVKVSYDNRRTRLHAKAWLFRRETGFSTAIIGSSNLSSAALRDGCEWNIRLSQRDNPALLAKFETTFEQYWADAGFEAYDRERFDETRQPADDPQRAHLARAVSVRPYPHQTAVLEALAAERSAGHTRNLVVAATGTGKTVMAALDYRRQQGRPRLLFVAHRDELLEQSRATFRATLQDGDFGEKLTGRERPRRGQHVFASIQTVGQPKWLDRLAPDAFDMVIVDEFHHAAAPTYERLLHHLQPRLLLGLTATPERADGRSVLTWFDGRIAAESRLWDALDQGLLAPFQYFGVADTEDLSGMRFSRGRYDTQGLSGLFTGNDARALAVLRAVHGRVRDPLQMAALGFCVSVDHARYMARYFTCHGIPSAALDGHTPARARRAARADLERGRINCLFTVDLFNEGVDIPRVDTVLFLRPTESATVFIQQLGRGLRLAPDKDCLTVLDFVARSHRQFRFDRRLRALLGRGTNKELGRAVEAGFPSLPPGCSIQLERAAQEAILSNLRSALRSWKRLAEGLERHMDLATFLHRSALDLETLYRPKKSFARLRSVAGFEPEPPDDDLWRAIPRLLHIDDPTRLGAWRRWLGADHPPRADPTDPLQRGLFASLGQSKRPLEDLGDFWRELWSRPALRTELSALFDRLDDRRRHLCPPARGLPLQIHARYSRAEVSAALGLLDKKGRLLPGREGVKRCDEWRCDLLFVTLEKDERHFTPTTLYDDYPITPRRFQWDSQSTTTTDSPTGRRYRHPEPGWQILLFVRRAKKNDRGETAPFLHLGPVRCIAHHGERPMKIIWELEHATPAEWFQEMKIAAG